MHYGHDYMISLGSVITNAYYNCTANVSLQVHTAIGIPSLKGFNPHGEPSKLAELWKKRKSGFDLYWTAVTDSGHKKALIYIVEAWTSRNTLLHCQIPNNLIHTRQPALFVIIILNQKGTSITNAISFLYRFLIRL